MSAALTDKFKKPGASTVTSLATPGKALAAASINVGSTENYPTDTGIIIAMRTVNTSGELVSGTYTEWKAIVSSDTSLTIDPTPVYGTDQVYQAGSTTQVFIPTSAYAQTELIDGILVAHNQDGTHRSGASYPSPTFSGLFTGWVDYTTVTPTRASADDPTYVMTFAGVDLTDRLVAGTRVKWTQNAITRFGIVTASSFSTNTSVTIVTRCDNTGVQYDVLDTATYTISNFAYSQSKSPVGFPLDPEQWTVSLSDSTNRQQSSPVQDTWYNLGSQSVSLPIGAWHVAMKASVYVTRASAGTVSCHASLSTASSSESDTSVTVQGYATNTTELILPAVMNRPITVAAKTTYYPIFKTNQSSMSSLQINVGSVPLRLRAVSAYL